MLVPIVVGRAQPLWRDLSPEKYQVVDKISINSTRLQFPWLLLLRLLLLWFVG